MYYKIVSSPVLLSDCISSFSREVDVFLSHHEGKGTDAHAELAQTVFEFFKYVHQTADDASCVLPGHASDQDKDAFRDYFEKFKSSVLSIPVGDRSQEFNGVAEAIQAFKFREFWNPTYAGASSLSDSGFSSKRTSPTGFEKRHAFTSKMRAQGVYTGYSTKPLTIPVTPNTLESTHASQQLVLRTPLGGNPPVMFDLATSSKKKRAPIVVKAVSVATSVSLTNSYLIPQNDADRYECKKVLNKAGKIVKWGVFQKADAAGPERLVYGWDDYQAKLSVQGYSMTPVKNEMFFRVSCPPNFDEACRMIYRIANGKDNYSLRGEKIYVFDLDRSFDVNKLFKERLAKDKLFTRDFGALKTPLTAQGKCDALNKKLT